MGAKSVGGKDGGNIATSAGKAGGRLFSSIFGGDKKKVAEEKQSTPQKPSAKQSTPQHGPSTARQPSPAMPQQQQTLPPPPTNTNSKPQGSTPPPASAVKPTPTPTPPPAADDNKKDASKEEDMKKSSSGKGKGLFSIFSRGGSSKKEEEKEKAKPMVLDSGEVKFDPKTGKFIFPETEEEKAIKAQIKAGPPPAPSGYKKMPSTASSPAMASPPAGMLSQTPSAPSMAASPSGHQFPSPSNMPPQPNMMSPGGASMGSVGGVGIQQQPMMMMIPGGTPAASPTFMMPSSSAPSPLNNTLRTPTSGMPPPPGMMGKRPPIPMANQYVDMFNS
eukprot:GDKK01070214.1.p1 GENE.GDKK01070214.1~~GDKK01070214.1.p1  ORF type:complete len:357 (+),score=67.98 GDKK01070214.1:78-1073(+)